MYEMQSSQTSLQTIKEHLIRFFFLNLNLGLIQWPRSNPMEIDFFLILLPTYPRQQILRQYHKLLLSRDGWEAHNRSGIASHFDPLQIQFELEPNHPYF